MSILAVIFFIIFVPIFYNIALHEHINALKLINPQGVYPSVFLIWIAYGFVVISPFIGTHYISDILINTDTLCFFVMLILNLIFYLKYIKSIKTYHKNAPQLAKFLIGVKCFLVFIILCILIYIKMFLSSSDLFYFVFSYILLVLIWLVFNLILWLLLEYIPFNKTPFR